MDQTDKICQLTEKRNELLQQMETLMKYYDKVYQELLSVQNELGSFTRETEQIKQINQDSLPIKIKGCYWCNYTNCLENGC